LTWLLLGLFFENFDNFFTNHLVALGSYENPRAIIKNCWKKKEMKFVKYILDGEIQDKRSSNFLRASIVLIIGV